MADPVAQVLAQRDQCTESQRWSVNSKSRRAVPKRTLFGTVLEIDDKQNLKDIDGEYILEGHGKPVSERYSTPQHLQEKLPGRDLLESQRQEFLQQKRHLEEASQQLKIKTEEALKFHKSQRDSTETKIPHIQSNQPLWLSKKDLEHSDDINAVDLIARGRCKRDRHQDNTEVYNKNLSEDAMENSYFNTSEAFQKTLSAYKKNREAGWRRHVDVSDETVEQPLFLSKPQSTCPIDLPLNIRHKFGSHICDTLLSDKDLLSMSIDKQKLLSGPRRPSKKDHIKSLPIDLESTYESLGQFTRYDVFPGLATDQTISQTKKEFTNEVHKAKAQNPDKFRHQRDQLTVWAEQNVLRERMNKAWNTIYSADGKKQ